MVRKIFFQIFIAFLLFASCFCFLTINLYAQDTVQDLDETFFNINMLSMYRTCESIEITGNEDQFDLILNILFSKRFNLYQSIYVYLFFDILIRLPYSNKARFYEYFAPELFQPINTGFDLINKNGLFGITDSEIGLSFRWSQNILLSYDFENYYPAVIQKLPAVPLSSSYYDEAPIDYTKRLPYPSFMLGGKQLPIYYTNAIYLFDLHFILSYRCNGFFFDTGVSTGEEGLDANSSKSFIIKAGYDKNIVLFYIGANLGERGSVPIKVYSQFFTLAFHLRFPDLTIALETVLNLHGIRSPYINPYDETYSDDISYFNFSEGVFIPDDLPNLIDATLSNGKKPPLVGCGGYIYLSYRFHINDNYLKIFSHFSFYDPNVNDESYIIYILKYRVVAGFSFNINGFAIIFSYTYTFDKVFLEIPQFYEAESRSAHVIANYDLFFGVSCSLF
jgi:hypothetical protein